MNAWLAIFVLMIAAFGCSFSGKRLDVQISGASKESILGNQKFCVTFSVKNISEKPLKHIDLQVVIAGSHLKNPDISFEYDQFLPNELKEHMYCFNETEISGVGDSFMRIDEKNSY